MKNRDHHNEPETSANMLPTVLCISGFDPTGGAGIQADIESIASMGCHPVSLITAATIQDTHNVTKFTCTDASLFAEQANTLLKDVRIHAIKIGLLGGTEIVDAVVNIIQTYTTLENNSVPVIYDPVLRAGGGHELATETLIEHIRTRLLPLVDILTPNHHELALLANSPNSENNIEQQIKTLQSIGCKNILLTGGDEKTKDVKNTLYDQHGESETFHWSRLPNQYHGSGCTLAASIAGMMAQGLESFTAINEAQDFTWQSLEHAYRISDGQWIPNRFFWARDDK